MSVVVPFHRPQDKPPLAASTPPAPPASPADAHAPRLFQNFRNMAMAEVVAELGFQNHSTRTAIDKLRALARHSGMPLPRNPRVVHGKPADGPANISARSIWDRGEWLAWRDFYRSGANAIGNTPPAPSQQQQTQLRHRLAERARAGAGGAA